MTERRTPSPIRRLAGLLVVVPAIGIVPAGTARADAGPDGVLDDVLELINTVPPSTSPPTTAPPPPTTEAPSTTAPPTSSTSPPSSVPPPPPTTEAPPPVPSPPTNTTTTTAAPPSTTTPATRPPRTGTTLPQTTTEPDSPEEPPASTVPTSTEPDTTDEPPTSTAPTTTAPELPPEPTIPLPPVTEQWQTDGGSGRLPSWQPGASLPVAGRAPFVTGGIAGVGVPTADALARSLLLAARSAPPGALPPHGSGSMRQVAFPVLGPTTYYDGWNDCRDGCTRRHEGTDLIGVRMQPLLAAVDGVVTRIDHDNPGISGVALAITDADGWRYNYFHLNNDLPGTDDRRGAAAWRTPPGLQVGDRVRAGQVIGYMGDSGNAEVSVPHLHFEIRDPSGTARPSFWSLEAAKARQACSIGLGPWSVVDTPTAVSDDVEVTTVTPAYGDGVWSIDSDGRVIATGDAALIMPSRSIPCDHGPTVPFGTDAAGWVIVDGRPAYHDPTVDAADRLARTRRLAGYRLPPMSI